MTKKTKGNNIEYLIDTPGIDKCISIEKIQALKNFMGNTYGLELICSNGRSCRFNITNGHYYFYVSAVVPYTGDIVDFRSEGYFKNSEYIEVYSYNIYGIHQ